MAIERQIKPKFKTKNDEIVAGIREAAGAGPPIDPHMRVKRLTAELAIAMALAHGGDWRVQFEPENGVVMIARRLPRTP
ncbi:hypothetical protein [Aquamicrobium sp.]|uniref:hypothetical protein n=1 Tax=Aquamicrobium sp. TaxID=1872579 RepID=UPI002583AAB0|nr:hypothetical protein [Aquamicrobium sp.]MCK9552249.1 hypothetical protein [Aquamicrobium sp.]